MTVLEAVPGIGPAIPYMIAAVALCAALTTILPVPAAATGVYGVIYTIVSKLGANFGNARNLVQPAPAAKAPPASMVALLGLGMAGALSGCSATSTSSPASDVTAVQGAAQADVAAVESALTAAEVTATVYARLAPCSTISGPVCADPTAVAKLKTLDLVAYADVKRAESAANDPTIAAAAQAAIAALQAEIATLPKAASKGAQ